MLTPRGFWFSAVLFFATAFAVTIGDRGASLLVFTLWMWFGYEWSRFFFQARFRISQLEAERLIDGRPISRRSVWVGQTVEVRLLIRSPNTTFRKLIVRDCVPAGQSPIGRVEVSGVCQPGEPLTIEYTLRPQLPGRLRFDGASVEFIDLAGLFRHRLFLLESADLVVLPRIRTAKGQRSTLKRLNAEIAHGHHRYRKPGSGSELLDLRDYRPGDPPKQVAWKVSARRDKLMTKEYEHEVPVRSTIFLDASEGMRAGPPEKSQFVEMMDIASTLIARLLAFRDPVGLVLFDDASASECPPGRGQAHLLRLYSRLAEAAQTPLAPTNLPAAPLIEPTFRLCAQVYPNLMHPHLHPARWSLVNWLPWSFPWQLYLVILSIGLGGLAGVSIGDDGNGNQVGLASAVLDWLEGTRSFPVLSPLVYSVIVMTLLSLFAVLYRLFFRIARKPISRKQANQRLATAAVLAVKYGLGPGGQALLLHDDALFSRWAQQLLLDHRRPLESAVLDEKGRYIYSQPSKIDVLSRALARRVAHGKDTEFFIILIDVLEIDAAWPKFLDAIKMVVSRRHQIAVIVSWPIGIPVPADAPGAGARQAQSNTIVADKDVESFLRQFDPSNPAAQVDELWYPKAWSTLAALCRRLGVMLLRADRTSNVKLLLDRVENIRVSRAWP